MNYVSSSSSSSSKKGGVEKPNLFLQPYFDFYPVYHEYWSDDPGDLGELLEAYLYPKEGTTKGRVWRRVDIHAVLKTQLYEHLYRHYPQSVIDNYEYDILYHLYNYFEQQRCTLFSEKLYEKVDEIMKNVILPAHKEASVGKNLPTGWSSTLDMVPGLQKATMGLPKATTGLPKATTGLPKATMGLPKATTGLPKATTGLPKATTGLPKATTGLPKATMGLPKATTGLPKATTGFSKTLPYTARTWKTTGGWSTTRKGKREAGIKRKTGKSRSFQPSKKAMSKARSLRKPFPSLQRTRSRRMGEKKEKKEKKKSDPLP